MPASLGVAAVIVVAVDAIDAARRGAAELIGDEEHAVRIAAAAAAVARRERVLRPRTASLLEAVGCS